MVFPIFAGDGQKLLDEYILPKFNMTLTFITPALHTEVPKNKL
jgi:hypothetical protein